METPYTMQRLFRAEVMLETFGRRTAENARESREDLFGVQNSRKAYIGRIAALQDPALMRTKTEQEKKLRDAVDADPKLKYAADSWDRVARAEKVRAELIHPYTMLEGGSGFKTQLFSIARTLVRAGEELPKKNADRLREFRESGLDELKFHLFSEEPIYENYEIAKMTDGLTLLIEQLGYDDPLVRKVMDGKAPAERAAKLVRGTKLRDVAERQKLFEADAKGEGKKALEGSNDPMIALAELVDPEARSVRKRMETEVDEPLRSAYADLARAKFAVEGTNTYPDATFTLRLSFGTVKGYEENGKKVPFETTFAGLYERSKENDDKYPFELPKRWVERKSKLDLKTPLNFVCTADIIGGNSGSPVINREAELVGIIFDGNIQSLALDFAYSDAQARAVSVCSQGILEGLRKVYDAGKLADELTGG